MKAFIEFQFGYCPLIWMFHSRMLNNRINKLHESSLRIVYIYKNSNLTFEELLQKDKPFTIHHRNLQKLATEKYKIKNNYSPLMMKPIFPDSTNPYKLRNKKPFQTNNVRTVFNGTETLSYRGSQNLGTGPGRNKPGKFINRTQKNIQTMETRGMHVQVMQSIYIYIYTCK